jgi:hypothetical protein
MFGLFMLPPDSSRKGMKTEKLCCLYGPDRVYHVFRYH